MNSLYTAEGVMDKHSLWQRYVPLVRHEALRLQVRLPASVELDDLLQAGGIGLLNAVERYDALQGTAFTTYATEVSNMSKAQIIQQAGNSVLSKANQVPQQVLSLLQG